MSSNFELTTADQSTLRTSINTKIGDILVAKETTSSVAGIITSHLAPVHVGANGSVLTADSTQTLGVKWAGGSSGPAPQASYVKTSLPSAAANTGSTIYVSNATGAHVTGSLAFSNGTSWIDVTTGVAVV